MHAITREEHAELHALNVEFTESQTMRMEEFDARREQIELKYEAMHNEQQIVPPVAAGVAPNFYKSLAAEFARFLKVFVAQKMKPLQDRIAALESGGNTASKFALPIYDAGRIVCSQTVSGEDLIKELLALRAAKPTGNNSDVPYGGIWDEAKEARANLFYTHAGSLWFCNSNTRDKPGSSPAFTLACKKGEGDRMRA
jgi:hypothetical protein